jgi:TRAP-type C4-dicarboxylate transport system permease small subunit
MKNLDDSSWKDAIFSSSTKLFLEDCNQTDDQFEKRNLLAILSSAVFMIAGPLFIYFGFYLLTSPLTVKWGSLSIGIGMFVLLFGFSSWQDRQLQIQWRLMKKENEEMKAMLQELLDKKRED